MAELKRALRLPSVIAASSGFALATMSIVATAQVATAVAGNTAWLAIVGAGVVCLLAALCFGELSGMYPTAAGVRVYLLKALGERPATILSGTYVFTVILSVGAESYVLGSVMEAFVPAVPPLVWPLGLFVLLGWVNCRGLTLSSGVQNALTYAMHVGLLAMSVAALTKFGVGDHNWYNPLAGDAGVAGFASAMATAIFLFSGFEWVTPLSEEVEDQRLIARGMIGAVLLLLVVYGLLSVALIAAVPKEVLAGAAPWTDGSYYDARPHIVFIKILFGPYEALGLALVGVASVLASATSFNAGILTTSRFLYAMSREKTMPRILSRLDMRYFTPVPAIIALTGIGILSTVLVYVTSAYRIFPFSGAGIEALMYALVAICLFRLRKVAADHERPFRLVGGRPMAAALAVIFAALCAAVFAAPAPEARYGLGLVGGISALMVVHRYFWVPILKRPKGRAGPRAAGE